MEEAGTHRERIFVARVIMLVSFCVGGSERRVSARPVRTYVGFRNEEGMITTLKS